MHTRFTSIVNELHSLGEIIPRNKLVRKVLVVLPSSWESKVNAITEAKDMQELTIDELVGNLKTYEMKKEKDSDSSMMAVESEANEYDSIFALMAQSDNDEDDDNDEDALTIELGDAEQIRDDLNMKDDLMVVAVDLKETIQNFSKEKNDLVEKVDALEQERDDLLVVIIDLKETIEELKAECKPRNFDKGKEVASEAHIKLENELNAVKTSLCAELEKNRQLQADLERVKNDLEKSLK
ncbi:PREDICTED: uncharacterized protein LOC109213740 [Nicotiana attenuata]|uniref:uncharacterized protein LOC109213740 n=1 Tax=Nicotiana attenuata TaxID=49451 RepID=UPI0009049F30|nr:PREDICTED: uncharacterized protein LOC109213740 [Nicotiana attenuata]